MKAFPGNVSIFSRKDEVLPGNSSRCLRGDGKVSGLDFQVVCGICWYLFIILYNKNAYWFTIIEKIYIFVNHKYLKGKMIGDSLRIIRKMRGLSLDDVVSLLDGMVTKQAISKYERGVMTPSASVLSALMKIYEVDCIRDTVSVYVTACWNFRRGKELSAKAETAIKNRIVYQLEKYLCVETRLGLATSFRNPFPKTYPITLDNMEKAAWQLRKKWHLGVDSIPSVCRMLERVGIKVIELEMDENVDGLSGWANRKIPFMALRKGVTVERKRFTALHELAHILFPMLENCSDKEKERYCHRFASALLFPPENFYSHIGKRRSVFSLEELVSLKVIYGISVAAIVHRAKDLGVITDVYYNHLFDDVINMNRKEAGWGSYPLDDKPERYDEICCRAMAEGLFVGDRDSLDLNMKLKFI